MQDVITFRGNKEDWNRFVQNIKIKNMDVWQVLQPYIVMYADLDIEKVKRCVSAALTEYYGSRVIDKMMRTCEVLDTDGKFVQIYNAELIEQEVFQSNKGAEVWDPILPGLGNDIARGERDYIIRQLLESANISKKNISEEQVTLSFLSVEAGGQGSTIILPFALVSNLYGEQNAHLRIKHKGNTATLDYGINLIFVPEKVIGDNIIVLEDLSCSWLYKKIFNPITNKPEILSIEIGKKRNGDKISLVARTIGQLQMHTPDRIKIFAFTK